MDLSSLDGHQSAQKAIEEHTSLRAKYIARLEAFTAGTQYAGLEDWFADGPEAKPLWERAPCFVYPIVQSAIDSNADMLFGNGRFPVITTRPEEDDAAVTPDGLTVDESENLDKLIQEIEQQTRFQFVCRQVFSQAQSAKSACALFGLRNGKFFVDTVKARWCTPEFDRDGAVSRLVVQYPYLEEYKDKRDGKHKVRAMMFRRVIDATSDVTMYPAELREGDAREIEWVADPNQVYEHGFGFCPVIWYAHMRECSMVNEFDGNAIHEHLLDEVRCHDFVISQRHRAALYAGDPQWTEIGVEDGGYGGPKATGRTASLPALGQLSSSQGGAGASSNQVNGSYVNMGATRRARRKSPGTTWQYESPDVKVALHTLPGDALSALTEHAKDLRSKLCESMAVVFFDSDDFDQTGEVSGRALEARKARQIERCDLYREDFGHCFILPAISMLLRIAAKFGVDGGLRAAQLKPALPALAKFDTPECWMEPNATLKWGPYISPNPEDDAALVTLTVAALQGGITTKRHALEKVRSVFGYEDMEAVEEALEKEADENMQRAMDMAVAESSAKTGEKKPAPAKKGSAKNK